MVGALVPVRHRLLGLCLGLLAACSTTEFVLATDSGADATLHDAGHDAPDQAQDAGPPDTGKDSGHDAGETVAKDAGRDVAKSDDAGKDSGTDAEKCMVACAPDGSCTQPPAQCSDSVCNEKKCCVPAFVKAGVSCTNTANGRGVCDGVGECLECLKTDASSCPAPVGSVSACVSETSCTSDKCAYAYAGKTTPCMMTNMMIGRCDADGGCGPLVSTGPH